MDVEIWAAFDDTIHLRKRDDESRPALEEYFKGENGMKFIAFSILPLYDENGYGIRLESLESHTEDKNASQEKA